MVLHVPDLGTNLLSIAAVTEHGMTVHFVESLVNFNNFDKTFIVGKRIGRTLYHLAITANPSDESAYLTSPAPPSIAVWHQRFVHVSCMKISQMAATQIVDGLNLSTKIVMPSQPCPGCMAGKMERSPFPIERTRAIQIGQLIHSDLRTCGIADPCILKHLAVPDSLFYSPTTSVGIVLYFS
jgi:hypothetical protein